MEIYITIDDLPFETIVQATWSLEYTVDSDGFCELGESQLTDTVFTANPNPDEVNRLSQDVIDYMDIDKLETLCMEDYKDYIKESELDRGLANLETKQAMYDY